MGKYLTAPVPSTQMPKGIPYIIGNEAAERFSFYGMKGILTIFMVSYLHMMGTQAGEEMPEARAESYFHLFTSAVYFTPFLGAIISDAFWGKYKTIINLSIVYVLGHLCLALMGIAGPAANWMLIGLGLISLGSGGIKPCVSAHVGDQFGKSNAHLITRVFFYFYFAINLGSALSNFATPRLLEFKGPHWAFGVPGILMAIATIVFWMGRNKFVHIPPQGKTFVAECRSKTGINTILKLLVIYAFVAVFWALFDQTGSSWVLQARDLDRHVFGFELLPSEIQAANPVLILILIPLFSFVVYPAIDKVWKLTPVRKIGGGLFVMVTAFALMAWLQGRIDGGENPSIGWQLLGYILLTASEVMVSITALEFSYTQAPRSMKSLIMATFLASVSMGNLFTFGVNHYIQIPSGTTAASAVAKQANSWLLDQLEETAEGGEVALPAPIDLDLAKDVRFTKTEDGFIVTVAGHDAVFDSDDDIAVRYALNAKRTSFTRKDVQTAGLTETRAAVTQIEEFLARERRLPTTEEGQALVAGSNDAWGRQLVYTLRNRLEFRINSDGPDQTPKSKWDVGHTLTVDESSIAALADTTEEEAAPPSSTWLSRRMAELGVGAESSDGPAEDPAKAYVGGQTTLEGAAYFWFFTILMLVTALIYIPVGLLYKPKEYIQEEAPAEA